MPRSSQGGCNQPLSSMRFYVKDASACISLLLLLRETEVALCICTRTRSSYDDICALSCNFALLITPKVHDMNMLSHLEMSKCSPIMALSVAAQSGHISLAHNPQYYNCNAHHFRGLQKALRSTLGEAQNILLSPMRSAQAGTPYFWIRN